MENSRLLTEEQFKACAKISGHCPGPDNAILIIDRAIERAAHCKLVKWQFAEGLLDPSNPMVQAFCADLGMEL